ncbi:MAG: transposase [Planctomycetota bacterium]
MRLCYLLCVFERIRKASRTKEEKRPDGSHRFEHWIKDNQLYFLTCCTKGHAHVFKSRQAQEVFWQCFNRWHERSGFKVCVVTLMSSHYHLVGYAKVGQQLVDFVQGLHGSTARAVNPLLDQPLRPFWGERKGQSYFDGCLRDEEQASKAWTYTRDQAVKAGLVENWDEWPGTRVFVERDAMLKRATTLGAYLRGVPYKRYDNKAAR